MMRVGSLPLIFLSMLLLSVCPTVVLAAVKASDIAIVVNTNDEDSIETAKYYQQKRQIPEQNVIRVALPVKKRIGKRLFQTVRQQIIEQTPDTVQFYVLAWSQPFRVGCMSVTSALTFGFDPAYCAKGCKPTRASSYFNSDSQQPYTDLGLRPSMLLAGESLADIKALIDRGLMADGSSPQGTAYLMSTSDKARNVRSRFYTTTEQLLFDRLRIERIRADVLEDKPDVLFYITGLKQVSALQSNHFLPGALADHLTSTGGVLFGSRQMSALKWLGAGATASYGTVVEPCAFPQKFPHPTVLIDRYTQGDSAIEAYWKSVAWPGQGVFIGEPMAAPFAPASVSQAEVLNKKPEQQR